MPGKIITVNESKNEKVPILVTSVTAGSLCPVSFFLTLVSKHFSSQITTSSSCKWCM